MERPILFARQRRISKLVGSDVRTLVSRINEPRAFISLLKGPFECAMERRKRSRGSWIKREAGRRKRGKERERRTRTRHEKEGRKKWIPSSRWKAMPVNESINNWFGNLQTKATNVPACQLMHHCQPLLSLPESLSLSLSLSFALKAVYKIHYLRDKY